jgi:hypothetical protein
MLSYRYILRLHSVRRYSVSGNGAAESESTHGIIHDLLIASIRFCWMFVAPGMASDPFFGFLCVPGPNSHKLMRDVVNAASTITSVRKSATEAKESN